MNPENQLLPGSFQVLEPVQVSGAIHSFKALSEDVSQIVFWKGCLVPDVTGRELVQNEASVLASIRARGVLKPITQSINAEIPYLVFPWKRFQNLLQMGRQTDLIFWLGNIRELAETIAKIHLQGFVHADIRPENCQFFNSKAYLIDFAMAQPVGSAFLGPIYSAGFIAPEAKPGIYKWQTSADLYAFGASISAGLRNVVPNPSLLEGKTAKLWNKVGGLCQSLCNPDPDQRPTAKQTARRFLEWEIAALSF
jgi:serine/threonine protein kinase